MTVQDDKVFNTVNPRRSYWLSDIVRDASVGDLIAVQKTAVEGDVNWAYGFVTECGDDWATFGRGYTVRVKPDDEELSRFCEGDDGVIIEVSDYKNQKPSPYGIERVPKEVFDEQEWYEWEIGLTNETVNTVKGSEEQTVFVPAPTRDIAYRTAKRWAGMGSGDVRVAYKDNTLTRNK